MSRRDRPSLPPLFPPSPTSSTSNYFDHSSMLPPPRVRTPSFSSNNLFGTSNSNRYGAFSVPPPALPSTTTTSITSTTATTRGTSCVPCKKGHLKCGKGQRPCQMCIKRGRPEECMEGIPPQQAELFMKLFHQKKTAILSGPGESCYFFAFCDISILPNSIPFSLYYPSFTRACICACCHYVAALVQSEIP
jgi:hypothetical protein